MDKQTEEEREGTKTRSSAREVRSMAGQVVGWSQPEAF